MAKRRVKKRTHIGAGTTATAAPSKAGERTPKSMVIRIGANEVGPSVTQLVKDTRSMMEPQTATRLKERRSNRLRDYTTMAGPLGVTHLLLFSRSKNGNTNLRLALTPRGPTLHFRVEKYSLSKDVHNSMKRPRAGGNAGEFLTPPLLVMNNFSTQPKDGQGEPNAQTKKIAKHLESLTTTVFQSLFPPINPTATPLKSIKRLLLLDRDTRPTSSSSTTDDDNAHYTLNLRHYAITTRPAKSIPKPLRRLDAAQKLSHTPSTTTTQKRSKPALPNLGKLSDVADYLLDPSATVGEGFTSGSESEPDTDAEVEVLAPATQKLNTKTRRRDEDGGEKKGRDRRGQGADVQKKAIKLHELGPRLRLRLTKVEEGVCAGKVMWHEYIQKTAEEVNEMEKVHEARRAEVEKRKAVQRENVAKKRAARGGGKGGEGDEDGDEEMEDDGEDEWDEEGIEDGDGDGDGMVE